MLLRITLLFLFNAVPLFAAERLDPQVALNIRNKQVQALKTALAEKDQEIQALQAQIQAMQTDRKLEMQLKELQTAVDEAPYDTKVNNPDKWSVDLETLTLKKKAH